MPRRLTNDLLLATLLALVLSGLLGWALPSGQAAPLYDLHRALGIALLLLLGWKQAIVLPSLRRRLGRDRSIVWGSLAAVVLLLAVAIGLAWALNLISFDLLWGYSPLNIHVALGIGLLPFVGWHALLRRRQNRFSAPIASRRSLLRLAGLAGASLVGWQAIQRWSTFSLPDGTRLASGSKQTTSLSANDYPAEIWLLDSVPLLDASTWQLQIAGPAVAAAQSVSFDALAMLPRQSVQAVLDCTSGWWTEQVWSGPRILDVLATAGLRPGAREITVTSVTGHTIVLPLADLEQAVLATHVGGEPLSPGHGYPVRLAVPGRRGYQWVKWVAQITVT
jgi:DMSO/TMAO reductase YedYZ molybdopterin-dependent catalytic subunit